MTMWTMILMMVITIIANPLAVCTWWSRDPLGLKMLQLDFRLWPFWETRLLLVGVIHHHPHHHHHPKDWSTIGRHHHHPEDFDIIILLNIIITINKSTLWRQLVCKISPFFITPLRSWWHPGRLSSPWLFSTTSGFAYFQWRWHLWTPQSSSFPQFIDAVKVFKMTAIDFQRSSKVILNPWYILLRWSSIELRSTK